jgi:hypothetical protein
MSGAAGRPWFRVCMMVDRTNPNIRRTQIRKYRQLPDVNRACNVCRNCWQLSRALVVWTVNDLLDKLLLNTLFIWIIFILLWRVWGIQHTEQSDPSHFPVSLHTGENNRHSWRNFNWNWILLHTHSLITNTLTSAELTCICVCFAEIHVALTCNI